MEVLKQNRKNKRTRFLNFFGGIFAAAILLTGAVSCGEGGGDQGPPVLADEEHVKDKGYDLGVEDETLREMGQFDQVDANNDGQLDESEMEAMLEPVNNEEEQEGYFGNLDTDADGEYTEEELNSGVFRTYDVDEDERISQEEFGNWGRIWDIEGKQNFEDMDINEDKMLDAEEFSSGVSKAGIYGDWETGGDQLYGESEVREGFFRVYDVDKDGSLNEEEFNQFTGLYMD